MAGGGGTWRLDALVLGLAIGLWVAGFDIIYACQDAAVDRAQGLKSIPVRFGIARALTISRVLHAATVLVMASLALVAPLGPVYFAGVASWRRCSPTSSRSSRPRICPARPGRSI